MHYKLRAALLTAAVILLIAASAAYPTTWDPAAEWSISKGNPNGVWTYGWFDQLGGTFTTNMTGEDRGDLEVWVGTAPSDAGLLYNSTDAYSTGMNPHQASLHPGFNGAVPVFRWTAPEAMRVTVDCTYTGISTGGTTTDVHVMLNGTQYFDGVIDGYIGTPPDFFDIKGTSPTQRYQGIFAVSAGDKIDLAVGYGNGTYSNDLTGIAATIATTTADVGTVQGTVRDSFSNAVTGALVTMAGSFYSAKSRADGTYTMLLPVDTYEATAAKVGYQSDTQSVTVTTGGTTVQDFVLGNSVFKGKVFSSLTGNPPLAGATVTAADSIGGTFSTTTGADGSFSLSLAQDTYWVEVSFPGYNTYYDGFDLIFGQTKEADYILELIPGDAWDAAIDFGPTTNPNNVWSYGYLLALDGPLTLYADYFSTGTLAGWVLDHNPDSQGSVMLNVSDEPANGNPYYWEAWQLTPHPGPGGRMATVRWTAPMPMYVDVQAGFTGQMMDLTTTDVHVTKSGVSLFDGVISGFAGTVANNFTDAAGPSPSQAYSTLTHVDTGDTIDFVIGPGPNANNSHDLTGLTATVSAVTQVGTLTGHVTAATGGAPLAGAVVTTVEEPYSTVTQADGSYTMLLPAGIWNVKAEHPLCDEQTKSATITADNTITCDFQLPVVLAQVTGHVTMVAGSTTVPAVHAKVACPSLGLEAYTDAAGAYSMVLPLSGTVPFVVTHPRAQSSVTADVAIPVTGVPLTRDFELTARAGGPFTYYVKPGGDDDAYGLTEATAWATIDNGDTTQTLQPGDTVIVEPGVYSNVHVFAARGDGWNGVVCLTRGGTPEAPVTYKAEPGVVIDCGGVGIAFQTWTGASNLILDGFEIRNAIYGMNLEDYGAPHGSNITVKNFLIHDCSADGIQVVSVADVTFANCVVYSVGGTSCYNAVSACNGLYVYNCVGIGSDRGFTLYLDGGTGIVVRNSIFVDNASYGIRNRQAATDLTEDHNLIISSSGTYAGYYYGIPGDATDLHVAPMFVDAAGHNYHLAAGSPCIDKGVVIPGIDYSGLAPDMGAFEYVLVQITNLRDARDLDAGAVVQVTAPQVATAATGTFTDGRYYIEDPNRTVGMMVVPASGLPAVTQGARVTLTGTIAVDGNGEKYIAATAQTPVAGAVLGALGMTGRTVAGCHALLVRIWGNVTSSDAATGTVVLDDGSGAGVTVSIADLVGFTGTQTLPGVGAHCAVTGIVGLDDHRLVIRPLTADGFSTF